METITNAASAAANTASKMIWGESTTANAGTEPVSGVKGSGTATDPYDGGNKEENATTNTTTKTSSSNKDVQHVDSLVPPASEGDPTHKRTDSAAQGVTPSQAPQPTQTAGKDGKMGGFGSVEPSVGADPNSAQQPTQKQQGGDRPNDEPSHEQSKAIKEEKHEAEATAKEEKPSSSPAPSGSSSAGAPTGAAGAPAGAAAGAGGPGNLSPPKDETSEEAKQGTGEKYIKSTGEASQGGDFDAAKAGAGREADRLLELKGVDRSTPESKKSPETSPSPASKETEKEKTSLSQKLKDKLHIGKH